MKKRKRPAADKGNESPCFGTTNLRSLCATSCCIMGPSVAGLDDSPRKSEEVHTRVSPVSAGNGSKLNAPIKVPYVTSALRRAHTVAQAKHIAKKTNIGSGTAGDKAAPPLVQTKDSHEVLRARSFKLLDTKPKVRREVFAGPRESSHFTVGNVGQNGKIFLR